MTAEIISVGTELLLGNILNTNAQYLSRELATMAVWPTSSTRPRAAATCWSSPVASAPRRTT